MFGVQLADISTRRSSHPQGISYVIRQLEGYYFQLLSEDVFVFHLRDVFFFQLDSCNLDLCIPTGDKLCNSIMNKCKLLLDYYKW